MDTNLIHKLNAVARSNDIGKKARFDASYGYGPSGQQSRWDWQQECLEYLLNKTKEEFKAWQQSWLMIGDGGTNEDADYRKTSHDQLRDELPEATHDLIPCSLDFTECTFSNLQVNEYEFLAPVNFRLTLFAGSTSFWKTIFFKKIDFVSSVFEVRAFFNFSWIKGESDFSETKFNGITDFSEVIFTGFARFRACIFENDAIYQNAKFSNTAYFRDVIFKKLALFSLTEFNANVIFNNVIFQKVAFFGNIIAEKDVYFNCANFNEKTHFSAAIFKSYVFFDNAIFHDDVYYRGAKFGLSANFFKTTFNNECRFDNELDEETKLWSPETEFRGKINFESSEIKNVGHFERVNFKGEIPNFLGVDNAKTLLVFSGEEYFNREDTTEDAIKRIGQLKRLADEQGQTDQALMFNAFELNAKAKQPNAGVGLKVVTTLYDYISDFGRSFSRPLGIYSTILFLTFMIALEHSAYNAPRNYTHAGCEKYIWWIERVNFIEDNNCLNKSNTLKLTGIRAAGEYTLYRAAGVLDFSDSDKQTKEVAQRLFAQEIEPWWMRIWGVFKAIASTALLFLAALGLRNKYRIK